MNGASAARFARAQSLVRAAAGAALLARPEALVRPLCRGRREPTAWIVRLLGARMLGQSLVEVARPRRDVLVLGAGVDAAHALSMVAVAAISEDYRPIALASAGTAAVSGAGAAAAANAVSASRHRAQP